MNLIRIAIKYKIYQIPNRCSYCGMIKWGSFCTERICNVESEIKLCGILLTKFKLKKI
jgi:hypothetical protein